MVETRQKTKKNDQEKRSVEESKVAPSVSKLLNKRIIGEMVKNQVHRPKRGTKRKTIMNPESTKKLTAKDKKEIKMTFNLFDVDGNGHLTVSELESCMRNMGFRPKLSDIVTIMKEADTSGNMELELDEFTELMASLRYPKKQKVEPKKKRKRKKKKTVVKKKKVTPKNKKKTNKMQAESSEDEDTTDEEDNSTIQKGYSILDLQNGSFSLLRKEAIGDYYSVNAGRNDFTAEERANEHSNPIGTEFDLGREGAFADFKVLVGHFLSVEQEAGQDYTIEQFEKTVGDALRLKGMTVKMTCDESEFCTEIKKDAETRYDCAVIISSENKLEDEDAFIEAVEGFHVTGGGLLLAGENDPYFETVNPVLKKLLDAELFGNTKAGKNLEVGKKKGDEKKKGKFGRHLLTTGITTLFEGSTIAKIKSNRKIQCLATSTDGFPCICIADYPQLADHKGRIVIDTGATKYYEKYWTTAGTSRYITNIIVWLLGIEHRMRLGLPARGPTCIANPEYIFEYYLQNAQDGKQKGWHPYNLASSYVLDKHYRDGEKVTSVQSGQFSYEVNFDTMKQTNLTHQNHTSRDIRRVKSPNYKITKLKNN